jgi:PAS domain S-box-containing protein
MNKEKGLQRREDSSLIRVLLIEDDPEDAQLLRDMLAEARGTRFDVKWADRLLAGLEHLAEGEIDVLLLDLSLPDSVGLDTVLTVHSQASGVPIVVLTGLDDEALAMKAVRKGAQDYLVKGQVDSNLLVRSMRYAIERKRAEEALRESEERFRQLAENIREVFWMTDPRKKEMIYVSPAYEEIWGRTLKSLYEQPRSFLDSIHSEDRGAVISTFEKQAQGKPISVEYRITRPDGSVRSIRSRGFPVRNELGEIYRIVGLAEDITERKRAEEALQKYATDLEEMVSERTAELVHTTAFLNNILDSSTEYAIVATDLKGTILNWNTGARNIFGYDAQEVIGKVKMNTFYEKSLLRGKKEKNILRGLVDIKSNKVNSNSPKLVRKNGKPFPADITATYLKNLQGKAIGILAIIRDITERKMLERQLIQSEKLAGIGTLAAGIAHEVRNPLSIINTSSYLLREEIIGKTEVVEDLLGQIEDGIKRTQTIINNLLDFSRPAARELESVDLKNLMEKILSLEGRILSTQNIELRSELNNVPKITANLDSLKHVFLNLLINAVQSMPSGGTLGIKTYQEDNRVTVEISDTGIGIAEKDLPNIFDPFFTTKEPGKGTGLGLAFVHSEIERMGATIRVVSKQKLGSTFTVEFPPR